CHRTVEETVTMTHLSVTTAPAALAWQCNSCHTPVADHDGYLYVLFGDVTRTREAAEQWEASREDDEASTLAEVLNYPSPAQWRVSHVDCELAPDDPGYLIPVERARTRARLLWWTSHLMGKTWLTHTNWEQLIKTASVVNS